jgi:integrase
MVQSNPFAHLPIAKSIAKRERVLGDDENGEIWRAAGDAASPYGTIIRLLILTGQRRGEVAGMNWGELSDDLSSWTMPGGRTKNGAVHTPVSHYGAADRAWARRAARRREQRATCDGNSSAREAAAPETDCGADRRCDYTAR